MIHFKYYLLGFSLLCLLGVYTFLNTQPKIQQPSVLPPPRNNTDHKTILYWNKFFRDADYFGRGERPFSSCAFNKCFITSDRNYDYVQEFDAIIFHAAEYKVEANGKPDVRKPHQRYIFYDLETPVNRQIDKHASANFYNWTMTYRVDSDLFAPYAKIIQEKKSYTPPSEEDVRKKNKLIAWFVSNCYTKSKREEYVAELAKHVPVDIYGACGSNECSKDKNQKCVEMVEKDYLFYLSFENSFCDDYITEKLYRMLSYNVVPVVRGLANYKKLAPPHSVINVADFKSVQELAKYLKYLHSNPKEYLKYFAWKTQFSINSNLGSYILCELCEKLHTDNETAIYSDMNSWWSRSCPQM